MHIRRLRAKLGPEHDALIGTVRNVGYRFVPRKAPEAEPETQLRRRALHGPTDKTTRLTVTGQLEAGQAAEVMRLVEAAAEADGVSPLSEHVRLHLRYGGDPRARNVLLTTAGELTGYAHLDPTDPVEGPSGELVIHPAHRGRGQGMAIVQALLAEADGRPLRLWAHGDAPAAARLAETAGFGRIRALWQMDRSLREPIEEPRYPADVTVRTFIVGQDEDPWVKLNRRAFARHPEQGAWTREDLDLREREPWFDPDGFFLAERDGRLRRLPLDQDSRRQRGGVGARARDDRRGLRGRRQPGSARQRARPGAHPHRAAVSTIPRPGPGHALCGRDEYARDQAL